MNSPEPLRRRNSIATAVSLPSRLSLHTSSLPPSNGSFPSPSHLDFELYSFEQDSSSYTSLKDLLPSSAVDSPAAAAAGGGGGSFCYGSAYEICIRNHLVKQAAWAYLQPMSASPGSDGPHNFLRRLWLKLRNPISACFRFVELHLIPRISRTFSRIFSSIWIAA
ncbi:hypothetical protein LINPERPRIM_LOCUS16367 [Linum perenne]